MSKLMTLESTPTKLVVVRFYTIPTLSRSDIPIPTSFFSSPPSFSQSLSLSLFLFENLTLARKELITMLLPRTWHRSTHRNHSLISVPMSNKPQYFDIARISQTETTNSVRMLQIKANAQHYMALVWCDKHDADYIY